MIKFEIEGKEVDIPIPTPSDVPLAQAQLEMVKASFAGTHCPCCGNSVKIYKRNFNKAMAASLLWFLRFFREDKSNPKKCWVSPSEEAKKVQEAIKNGERVEDASVIHVVNSREFTKLKYWDMLELCDVVEAGKKTSGKWGTTGGAAMFGKGRAKVPAAAYVFRDRVLTYSSKLITIFDAFQEVFDYDKLMSSPIPAKAFEKAKKR